jgi:hypothetical protein
VPMMILASEPPMKVRLLTESGRLEICLLIEFSYQGVIAMLNVVSRQQFLLVRRPEHYPVTARTRGQIGPVYGGRF